MTLKTVATGVARQKADSNVNCVQRRAIVRLGIDTLTDNILVSHNLC